MTKKERNNSNSSKQRLSEIIKILHDFKISEGVNPEKFRLILERLGPTYIKFGQIMSMRSDILPEEYCKELTKLRNKTTPLAFKKIKDILKDSYKKSLSSIFENIEETPIGSASIAQVHKATLVSGEKVVIKIQKPGIYETMAQDIKLLKKLFSIIKVPFIEQVIDLKGVLDEIWTTAKQELDFLIEASHISEFSTLNQELVFVKTPRVYSNLCSTNILVMECIDGITINDKDQLIKNGYDLEEISIKLANSFISQVIDHGYFHADPHPDNLVIQDGKIVFLDFGMMGRLSSRDKNILKDCMHAIFNKDVQKIEQCILTLGEAKGEINHPAFLNDLEIFINKYSTLSISNINIGVVLNDLLKLTTRYKIRIPKNITILTRSIIIIEGLLNELTPNINLMEVLKSRVSTTLLQEMLDKEKIESNLRKLVIAKETMLDLPKETLDLVKMVSRGNAKLNLELTDSNDKIGKIEKMLNKLILAALDVACIVAGSLLYTNDNNSFEISLLRKFSLIGAFTLTIFLVILMFNDLRKKNKA